ncbi:UPF0295 protein YgzB [Caldalkalibacillus thermarum]|uniref:DUF2614 family zinc ribbon-containing protein n=1 Tax=Caldalkalibacillus thermarum TaxID=296745 RepID=UPI0016634ABF|nr:DUF2614 family zinc ribbon-containing protein [Caldalkalibacillus thermarum]GGK28176.1 UPF0295 protein YgzB [Caldalkalibacillus thermarum]
MFGKGKINIIRTFALGLVFGGMIVMYGSFFVQAQWAMWLFIILGLLMVLASTLVYFWIGYISSTRAVYVLCPNCDKTTKMLGKVDECMHCKQKLTLDPQKATDVHSTQSTDINSTQ